MAGPIPDLPFGAEPDVVPAAETAVPRSEAHLQAVNKYRLELAQGFRCVSAVSGHLAIIAETGDPHGVFDQQVAVLDTLVRQVGNSLSQLQALAESKGMA